MNNLAEIWFEASYESFLPTPTIYAKYDYETHEFEVRTSELGGRSLKEISENEKQIILDYMSEKSNVLKLMTAKGDGQSVGVHQSINTITVRFNGQVTKASYSERISVGHPFKEISNNLRGLTW